jgi:diketogulonate reductase-like aldo/keto reductase
MKKVPDILLNDGTKIPQIGLGLYLIKDEADFMNAFKIAYDNNYRLFDSAQFYKNEHFLAKAIKEYRINRKDIFVTTKIAVNNFGYKRTLKSFDQSLKKLDSDYFDLVLLHFPVPVLRKQSWKALEKIKLQGVARSIGVSNYTIKHLEELKKYANILPSVNQVELHLFLEQPKLLDYCNKNNIKIEAYAPLAHGLPMDNPIVLRMAKKYNKTYAQIMLRFDYQLGLIIIPKSITKERIIQNINILDFEITAEDFNLLKTLDKKLRTCWDPTRIP